MSYDAAGNQTQLVDISAGTINSTYTKFGELKTQTNANGNITTFNYSPEGLISSRETLEGTTTYTYINKQLTGISNPTTRVSRTFIYDTKGRVSSTSETIPDWTRRIKYPVSAGANWFFINLGDV